MEAHVNRVSTRRVEGLLISWARAQPSQSVRIVVA